MSTKPESEESGETSGGKSGEKSLEETSSLDASKRPLASDANQSGYDSAKLRFVGACGCIAAGLAVAGSVDRATGGVLVLIGWIAGVATLHRLGRAGSNAA